MSYKEKKIEDDNNLLVLENLIQPENESQKEGVSSSHNLEKSIKVEISSLLKNQKKIKNIDQFQKSLIDKYELEIRNLKIENKNYNQKIKDEIVKEVNIHFSKKKKLILLKLS